jgi:hypothetical protein
VALFNAVGALSVSYYFNTVAGHWEQVGGTANANNTIIYPYAAMTVTRRPTHPDTSLMLLGRVTPVGAATKTVSRASVLSSSHYATDVKLSQLKFGSNWLTGISATVADTLSVWNATLGKFEVYYQKPDLTWRKYGDNVTDQSNFTIPAGSVTAIGKRRIVTGAAEFLVSELPYSLE